jgi:cell division septation protein DedD
MRNKEFREVQVSSSGLVFIFLAVLVLGVFIFLLGVSVGKKQVRMAGPTTILARPATEIVSEQPPAVLKDQPATAEPASGSEVKSEAKSQVPEFAEKPAPRTTAPEPTTIKPAATKPAPPAPATSGSYYIQVGAFFDKAQATAFTARFKSQGYGAIVLDPLPSDKKTVYRVRVGGYPTREQAARALAKLNAATTKKTGYYITKG